MAVHPKLNRAGGEGPAMAVRPPTPGATTPPHAVLVLQRTVGNAAVSRLAAAGAWRGSRVLGRAPQRIRNSRPVRYLDPNIPGATLEPLGQRLHDGMYQYRVVETDRTFLHDPREDVYLADDGRRIDPRSLAPPTSTSTSTGPGWPGDGGDGGGGVIAPPAATATIGPLVSIHAPTRKRTKPDEPRPGRDHDDVDAPPAKRARPSRTRWCPLDEFERSLSTAYASILDAAIARVFGGMKPLKPYNMQGEQKATTHAEGETFQTTLQKHSEMCALEAMLEAGTYVLDGGIVRKRSGRFVFTTPKVPHCGFCTFFLALLGLPLSIPSRGNFNLACNLNYPLPAAVLGDAAVLNRLLALGGAGPNAVGAVLQLAAPGSDVTWAEFASRGYLQRLWRLVLDRLYRFLS